MFKSKLWPAQDALLDLISSALAAHPDTEKVPVSLGVFVKMPKEGVWISGEVDNWDQSYAYSGLVAKDEKFTLRVCILSMRLGMDYSAIRDRVAFIGGLIEAAIQADPQLGGLVMKATVTAPLLEEAVVGERERAVGLNFDIEVETHVVP